MTASAPQPDRHRQRSAELCAASLRAVTGEAELCYRGTQPYRGMQRIVVHAPHLRIEGDGEDFAACRAAADATALRLLHSDADLHRAFCPDAGEPIARLMFEWLEQMRVEALVREDMPGMQANLTQRFEDWSRDFHRAGLAEGRLGILLYTAAQMCWSRLTARRVLEETEDHIESTRFRLTGDMGAPLAGMRRCRGDQRQFAVHALQVARLIAAIAQDEQGEGCKDAIPPEDDNERQRRNRLALLLDFEPGDDAPAALALSGDSKAFDAGGVGYRVFTTRYDTEVEARSLVRPALLREYREKLDRRVAAQGINLPRLARLLRARLSEPRRDGWQFGMEDGRIDGRRLAWLVGSPAERRVFRQERQMPVADCMVSLLVDCSGSMKAHAEAVATLADILLRALDMAGVGSELLGFGTGAWNGGRAWRDWLQLGRPAQPGRLNEALHLVFKDAGRNWRRARPGIAALLKADLFREGIDGEAVDWACGRMLAHGAQRRILVVISDGCPNDSATGRANDAFYLDNHLKAVVARHEREGAVRIVGLGVGLDLSPFYRYSLSVDPAQGLGNALLDEIVELVCARPRRQGRGPA